MNESRYVICSSSRALSSCISGCCLLGAAPYLAGATARGGHTSTTATSVRFGFLDRVEEVIQVYLVRANLNKNGIHESFQSLELVHGFGISMRLSAFDIGPMLLFYPSFVPFAMGHLFEHREDGCY